MRKKLKIYTFILAIIVIQLLLHLIIISNMKSADHFMIGTSKSRIISFFERVLALIPFLYSFVCARLLKKCWVGMKAIILSIPLIFFIWELYAKNVVMAYEMDYFIPFVYIVTLIVIQIITGFASDYIALCMSRNKNEDL